MKKREIRQAAARLRGLGRVVPVGRSDEERLQELQQGARNQDTYEAAGGCPGCAAARHAAGDQTALCEEHLRRAMGL